MKRGGKIIKRFILFLLMLLLSTNNFAAIVSDNDGSAFVTKAEFDALKSSFNKQINDYNSSIDGKIDGAIASYLAGLKLASNVECVSFINSLSKYYWIKDWAPVDTHIGSVGKIYIVVKWNFNNISGKSVAQTVYNGTDMTLKDSQTTDYSELVMGTSTTSRDNAQWMTVPSGSTITYANMTCTLVYRFNDTFNTTTKPALSVLYLNKSYPESQMVITGGHTATTVDGSSGRPDWSSVMIAPTATVDDSWGSYNYSATIKYDGAGNTGSLVGIAGWQQHDEVVPLDDFYYALPDKKYTDSNIQTLFIDETGKIGQQRPTCYTVADGGDRSTWNKVWRFTWTGQRTTATNIEFKRVYVGDGGETKDPNSKFGVYLHEHKVNKEGSTDKTYKVSNICLDDVSSVTGQFVTYGDGIPLFESSAKGKVKFKLNTGKLSTESFEIRNAKFNNTDMNTTPFETLSDRNATITKDPTSTADNNIWDIQFDTKVGETYWIMCKPTTNDKIFVKTEGNITITIDN